MSMKCQP